GPLSITISALGTVPRGQALKRAGAKAGDAICVTGTLGDAALALQMPGAKELSAYLRERLDRPLPRLAAGMALRGLAHAAIDLSDGLAGDLVHILEASGAGAEVHADKLPMSAEFERLSSPVSRLPLQAQGGDDYELCACIPPARIGAAAAALDVPLTVIGRVTAEPGLRFLDADGVNIPLEPHGYRHFP
ncbi:MAG: thiamine-phosphate kinase, partial [Stenotrophobium sp.]